MVKFKEIETRACLESDFNWEGNENADSIFFPTEKSVHDLKKYWRSLRCAKNSDDLYTAGNYDTATLDSLMVVFEKCTYDFGLCATDDEIATWLGNKYIITLENQKRFI